MDDSENPEIKMILGIEVQWLPKVCQC
jgi:hypothetical protein